MTDQDEQDELARSLQGDGEAYARIVRRYQSQVAGRMRLFSRQPLVVEELVQEVFVEAYYSLRKYRAEGPFAAWLTTIATRVGYAHWKKNRRSREEIRDASWWKDIAQHPIEQLDPTRASELVHQLLDQLPPRDRLVMLLVSVEGRTVEEAARLSGWSQAMVKVQAFRARRKLRLALARAGIDSIEALAASQPYQTKSTVAEAKQELANHTQSSRAATNPGHNAAERAVNPNE